MLVYSIQKASKVNLFGYQTITDWTVHMKNDNEQIEGRSKLQIKFLKADDN